MKKRSDRPPTHRHATTPAGQRPGDEADVFLEAVALLGVGAPASEPARPAPAPTTAQRIAAARPADRPSTTRADADARVFEEAMRALDAVPPKRTATSSPTVVRAQQTAVHDAEAEREALRAAAPKIEADSELFLAAVRPLPSSKPLASPIIASIPDRKQIRVVADLDTHSLLQAVDSDQVAIKAEPPAPSTPTRTTLPDLPSDRQFRAALEKRRVRVDASIDLHGFQSLAARDAVLGFVREALVEGHRVVRIVHGKGLHSEGDPVLRDLVRRVLRDLEPDPVRLVTTAPASLGGAGAAVVLLKSGDARTSR